MASTTAFETKVVQAHRRSAHCMTLAAAAGGVVLAAICSAGCATQGVPPADPGAPRSAATTAQAPPVAPEAIVVEPVVDVCGLFTALGGDGAYTDRPTEPPELTLARGLCLTRQGRVRDGAQVLRSYLIRAPKDVDPVARRRVVDLVHDAGEQLGVLSLAVDEPGAELAVDSVNVDDHRGNVFVEPGLHHVTATVGEATETVAVRIAAGQRKVVELKIPKAGWF